LLIVVVATACFLYFGKHATRSAQTEMKLSGNVEAHESLVGFKVSGRIVELPVEEGQSVTAGQLIARLDSDDFRQQLALDLASQHVRDSQLKLALAGSRTQEIQAAHDSVVDAQADLAQKTKDYERYEALYKKDEVTGQTRDQAETNVIRARATLGRLQQAYNEALEGTRKEQIAVDRANLHQASNAAGLSQVKLAYTELNAPLTGVVLVRQAELGEVVSPASPVVTIADLDHLWIRVYLPETDLGKLRFGDQVSIATDTYPGKRYAGRVAFISSEAEFTPKSVQTEKERVTLVYRVKVDVDNTSHDLKPGMPADVFVSAK
jgi:HlyD family secretion protein